MSETFDQYAHSYLNDPDSELFTSTTISRFSELGEADFADDYPCIQERVALAIVSGTSVYDLPDGVLRIRRVAWKGIKLDPMPHRSYRENFQSANQSGRPFWYVYNNIGLNTIKLFPIPNESLSSITTDLYGSEIKNRLIIDYYRSPDYVNQVIPLYFRRRLLKSYVMAKTFSIEGPGQNLKNAKYFRSRWLYLKQTYGTLLSTLHTKPRKLLLGSMVGASYFPGTPILPMDRFGSSVSTGE